MGAVFVDIFLLPIYFMKKGSCQIESENEGTSVIFPPIFFIKKGRASEIRTLFRARLGPGDILTAGRTGSRGFRDLLKARGTRSRELQDIPLKLPN